jgi:hypothetical protein
MTSASAASPADPPPSGEANAREAARIRGLPQATAAVIGVLLVFVGLAGFVPGLTTAYGRMAVAGPQSMALLLGLFAVSVLHNALHLVSGVAGLVVARSIRASFWYLIGGGAGYLVLWLYGLVVDQASAANFMPFNSADNWLHLGLGVVKVALGLIARGIGARVTNRLTGE